MMTKSFKTNEFIDIRHKVLDGIWSQPGKRTIYKKTFQDKYQPFFI